MNKRLSKYFTFYYKNNPVYNIDYRYGEILEFMTYNHLV